MEEEDDLDPRDKPAEEETMGVVDVPRREMSAKERRPPQWLGKYISCLYRIFHTEPVFGRCDVVNKHGVVNGQ